MLVVEAEWAIAFPDGMPAEVDPSTPVVMHGLGEGKWLNRLIGTHAWQPASIGNNVLTEGPGIPTSLGALELGRAGTVRLSYERADGGLQEHSSPLEAISGNNVLDLVREVLRVTADDGGVDAIDLGALGEQAAIVNEPARIKAADEATPDPAPREGAPRAAGDRRRRRRAARRTVELIVLDGSGDVGRRGRAAARLTRHRKSRSGQGRINAIRSGAGSGGRCRSCERGGSRSRDDEARALERSASKPQKLWFPPSRRDARREPRGAARARGASRADDELERFAVGGLRRVGRLAEPQLEDAPQGVDDVRPRLLPRLPLAVRPGNLGNRGDDPSVLTLLVDDRHAQRFAHVWNLAEGASGQRASPRDGLAALA